MQLPAIKYAREQNYYTILCDYLPDNPGQYYSNEYHCVSTTDKEAILDIAKKSNIDGILAYISDSASPTAAYVANKLNLTSYPYESVQILTKKDLFRHFLLENGFNCPRAEGFRTIKDARKNLHKFYFPLIIKPVDSSGSRGVSKINNVEEFDAAFEYAISYSRENIVIIEEYIEKSHKYQIGGDVFIVDGKLDFCGLLNCHRNNEVNPFIPVGKSYPILLDKEKTELVRYEIQKVINLLNLKTGPLNIEIILGDNQKPYIIEIGPRNGGNLIPHFLEMVTGVDLIKATVETALGNRDINVHYVPKKEYYATYTIHSSNEGKLAGILFENEIKENIVEKYFFKEKGSTIDIFNAGNKALGFVFLKFKSMEELECKMERMNQYIKVQLTQKEEMIPNN